MRTLLFVPALLVIVTAPATAEEFVFENQLVRYIVGSDGQNKGLRQKEPGREWLANAGGPVAQVKKGGKVYNSTTVARDGDKLRVGFGDSDVTAEYRVTPHARYFVVELVSVGGEGVEEITLLRLDTKLKEHVGWWLDVRWNDEFAVCLTGLSPRVHTTGLSARVYREFGTTGEKVALVAAPTPQLMDIMQEVEREQKLPSPKIAGHWAKTSPDVRRGYLFIDLTEANVDETIRYAKLGEFGYIMTYDGTWASSLGSYPINLKNFPKGEESLKATVDKCHAAGLKVGMHMLTSFVGKNDPLVRPTPDRRLLKDGETALAADIDAAARDIPAAGPLDAFPDEGAFYGDGRQGRDLVIDEEIVHYERVDRAGKRFLRCVRGFAGTKAAPHKAGAKVFHLCERYGCYLVDLRTTLKDELAERVAGVYNRCGFDMIYFDGGECNMANGPFWYWVSLQQMAIYDRVRRDIFVQGSGGTPWTWHIFARSACDDFAAVAPKQYLDYHKIADSWRHYRESFMPAELGWWGFLDDAPYQPATGPDEVEYYAVRMLALDTPVSLETNLAALKRNGRTEELLKLLGQYERLRLSGAVPAAVREKLRQGEWHITMTDGKPQFRPIRYDTQRSGVPETVKVANTFAAQPLRFRLQAVPAIASPGDKANVVLLECEKPATLALPAAKAPMPGALAAQVDFTKPAGAQTTGIAAEAKARCAGGQEGKALDLVKHRALAITLRVDAPAAAVGEPCAVLNVQLEAGGKTYRDYYVNLDFTGQRTIVVPEPTTERMLPEFRPAHENYAFKAAMYGFQYPHIVALNLRWMRLPPGKSVQCAVERVEALAETDVPLKNPEIAVGGVKYALPAELKTGEYVEFWADGPARHFDRNGVLLGTIDPPREQPMLAPGENTIGLSAAGAATVKFTAITLGDAAE